MNVINDKFIVAQNIQKNKQMYPTPHLLLIGHNEAELLKPMTTASPMVQAKCVVIPRDDTNPTSASLNN